MVVGTTDRERLPVFLDRRLGSTNTMSWCAISYGGVGTLDNGNRGSPLAKGILTGHGAFGRVPKRRKQ